MITFSKRILQIITRLDSIGGAQRHVAELCMAAVEQGHELHLAYGGESALSIHRLANGIICVSAYDKQHAERIGLTASKLKLIYMRCPWVWQRLFPV